MYKILYPGGLYIVKSFFSRVGSRKHVSRVVRSSSGLNPRLPSTRRTAGTVVMFQQAIDFVHQVGDAATLVNKPRRVRVRYLWPLAYWISSTPMARIDCSVRCSRPQPTKFRQSTRRMRYSRKTRKPHSGTNSKHRWGEMIVTGRGLVAPRADRRRALPRPDVHFDAFLVGAEAGVLVDESPLAMAVV